MGAPPASGMALPVELALNRVDDARRSVYKEISTKSTKWILNILLPRTGLFPIMIPPYWSLPHTCFGGSSFLCSFKYWKTRKQVAFCHIHKSQSWKVRTSIDKPWLNRAFQSFNCNSLYACLRAIDYAPTGKSAVWQSDCKACQLFYRLFSHLRMSKKFRPSCALHSLAEDLEFCLRAMSVSRPCDSAPFSLEK